MRIVDLILRIIILGFQIILLIEYCKTDMKVNEIEKELDSLWLDDQGDYAYWENENESGEKFKD